MSGRLLWSRDGRDWPNRDASRFVEAGGIAWHVQVMGTGPVLLLLHGTAASTHSFRALAPRLASRFTVIIPDLPGHAFTAAPADHRMSLTGIRDLVRTLLDELGLTPDMAVGHSAGAAILVRMALDGRLAPRRIVALNGALLPFAGAAGHVASPLARLLFLAPVAPRLVALVTGPDAVRHMIGGMGSRIDRQGLALYARLLGDPAHVRGALGLMAHWDLDALARDLAGLTVPLTLVVGDQDRAVPPDVASRVKRSLPAAEIRVLRGLGHLAHEERPDRVADLLLDLAEGA